MTDGEAECSCPTDDGKKYFLANNEKECIEDVSNLVLCIGLLSWVQIHTSVVFSVSFIGLLNCSV